MMPMQAEINRRNLKTPYDISNFKDMLRDCFDLQLTPIEVKDNIGNRTSKRGHVYKINKINLHKKATIEHKRGPDSYRNEASSRRGES